MRIYIYFAVIIGASIAFVSSPAESCSVCRCGDNAFQFSERGFAVPDESAGHRFWMTMGNTFSSKSNPIASDEGPGTERQREFRPSLRLFFAPVEYLSLSLEAPFQFRRLEAETTDEIEKEKSWGFGDMEISGVWMHNLWSNDGQFYAAGLSLSIKLPTGRNNLMRSGERLDEHLQPGTGTFDWQIGGAVSRVTCSNRYFASVYYRRNGTNSFDYHYGNAMLYNLGGQWPVADWLSGLMQINGRKAGRDIDQNSVVQNTGGWISYLSPGLRVDIMQSIAFSAIIQIPIYQKLFDDQTEKTVVSSSLSYEF